MLVQYFLLTPQALLNLTDRQTNLGQEDLNHLLIVCWRPLKKQKQKMAAAAADKHS